ncbi:MAG TPA: DUF4349 domain-containing protein [Thermoleophilia bacterium]|nr:DUF4349 domain-containing protein [Thermoleophilia bacterium]
MSGTGSSFPKDALSRAARLQRAALQGPAEFGFRMRWAPALALALLLGLLIAGCGGDSPTRDVAGSPATTIYASDSGAPTLPGSGDQFSNKSGSGAPLMGESGTAGIFETSMSLDRKIVSNATLLVEVERGQFQIAFDQALLLADKFGGYVVSSNSTAADAESTMRSGTIALRVPETAFTQALSDAAKLGTVKSRNVDTQDVTEEYLDLGARLKNAEVQEKAFLALMDKAKTIDEILQVRQVLSQTQMEIEQLKGRIRFLDEHTSFSTLTISLYEAGSEFKPAGSWGFVDSLKDALHAFVDSVNEIIVFMGGALPVLVLLVLLAWLGYRLIRLLTARTSGGRGHQRHHDDAGPAQPAAAPAAASAVAAVEESKSAPTPPSDPQG